MGKYDRKPVKVRAIPKGWAKVTDGFTPAEKAAVAMLDALSATGHAFTYRPTGRDVTATGAATVTGWAIYDRKRPAADVAPVLTLTTDGLYAWLGELSAFAPFAPPVKATANGRADAEKRVKASIALARRAAKAHGTAPAVVKAKAPTAKAKATAKAPAANVVPIRKDAAPVAPVAPVEAPEAPTAPAHPARPVEAPTGALPDAVEDWLSRLVYGPKAEFARAYCAAKLGHGPAPEAPAAEWAGKAIRKADRVLRAAGK